MAHSLGKGAWNFNPPESKPQLTDEAITAKSRQIAADYQELFLTFATAVNRLAAAQDVLGLQCFATAAKQLLADAVLMCADGMGAEDILE